MSSDSSHKNKKTSINISLEKDEYEKLVGESSRKGIILEKLIEKILIDHEDIQ